MLLKLSFTVLILLICSSLGLAQSNQQPTTRTSLEHFRTAEAFYSEHNYQSAAIEFSKALQGDLEPKWIEVWSRVNLGKIFDITGQRDRAIDQYKLAQKTNDNTRNAQEEAAKYLETPFEGKR